jgi:glycolate oxidase FAD binding subunit
VLRFASEQQLAVIPRGHGTKLATGNPPRQYDIALCLQRLNHVIHYEPADLTIALEPGTTFAALQELVGRDGLWLPLDPRGGDQSTIGGIIAANAVGPLRQGFGGPRDMVLGLRIATTDGKVVKTGGRVVKNVAGYDLGKLMTGSFGTLGVIVEACLKLFPKPPERATFALKADTLRAARDLRRSTVQASLGPMRWVLLDTAAKTLLARSAAGSQQAEAELWIELGGSNRVIERCMLELRQCAAAVGASCERVEDAEGLWQRISNLAAWLEPKFPGLIVLKAALPPASSEEFLSRAWQEAQAEGLSLASFAQVGVGIIYLCVCEKSPHPKVAAWLARVRHAATELRGALVIEHCPVDLKSQVDVWDARGDDVAFMRKLKAVWDPHGVLAPGRFLGF